MPGPAVARHESQQDYFRKKSREILFHVEGGVKKERVRSWPDLSARWPRKRLPCWRPRSPLPELLEDHPVGEALAADPNALENPVAAQLVQHQVGVQFARLEKTHAFGLAAMPRN